MMMNTFSLVLVVAVLLSGAAWLYDLIFLRPGRRERLEQRLKAEQGLTKSQRREIMEPSGFIGQMGSLFFVILLVFVIRSFLLEPFRIPSGSMMPTLLAGDFIAVNKYCYGLRNPLTNEVVIPTGTPRRGDIVVFKYPRDTEIDYIKRVVGLPGDTIIYRDKQIYVLPKDAPEGSRPEPVERSGAGTLTLTGMAYREDFNIYEERLGEKLHQMMVNPAAPELTGGYYRQEGSPQGTWKVPPETYFVMGDNRDNSQDSRFWGFVPHSHLVGRAIGIWMSFEFARGEQDALPGWIPSAVRFDRLGGVR